MAANEGCATPVFCGEDDGHYNIKIAREDGTCYTVPSRGKAGRHLPSLALASTDAPPDGGLYTSEEGRDYTVHESLSEVADTRFAGYPSSELNRVFVHHGLRVAGCGGKQVVIATGLPVSYYYLGPEPNTTLIDAKRENLKRAVTCHAGPCAHIVENFVTTQAIAAYFDQIMDFGGKPTSRFAELSDASIGVIDVGGKTTDCAVLLPGGQRLDASRSGSSDVGVLHLHDHLRSHLRAEFAFESVSPRALEQVIQTGRLRAFGEVHDVSALVEEAKERLAVSVMEIVRARIGNGADLQWVLFVGGGAAVLKDQLSRHFRHARFDPQPGYANARGMLKIAKFVLWPGRAK